jgi:phage tail protein X
MKRISFLLLAALALGAPSALRAQDAVTEERLSKLSGRLDDLAAAQETFRAQIADLSREIQSLREQVARPSASYARPEDLNRLAEAVKEVDRKRMNDADKTQAELLRLRELLKTPMPPPRREPGTRPPKDTSSATGAGTSDRGFEYVIKSGDTLDAIVQAYREKNVKVSVSQILNANPGLKAERLRVGQKIFIPAP